jgi:hypothetical protein
MLGIRSLAARGRSEQLITRDFQMHVSTGLAPRARLRKLFTVSAALVTLCVASISSGFAAVTYDEKVRAPQDITPIGLQKLARDYFGLFNDAFRTTQDVVRDPALYSQWVELRWHLNRALDRGVLGEALAEFGITTKAEGSYAVDVERFPQWTPRQSTLYAHLLPGGRDHALQYLKSRGLSDADLQALREYLEANSYRTHEGGVSPVAQAQLAESFAVWVQAKLSRGQMLHRTDTMSFVYQRFRLMQEQPRKWCAAMLNSVDPRAQQILEAIALEYPGGMSMTGSDQEGYLAELEQGFVNGEILRQIQADAAAQGARD